MAKKSDLDTPFRTGETVVATRVVDDIAVGTKGKIRLANGLGTWSRYWVRFEGDRVVGQVDHDSLVRPHQLDQWQAHQERKTANAEAEANPTDEPTKEVGALSAGGSDIASKIPAHLLERSKEAKARLLG